MLEDDVLKDAAQSDWLRTALLAALACDPVRAANDAEFLASILRQRAERPSAGLVNRNSVVDAKRSDEPADALTVEVPVALGAA